MEIILKPPSNTPQRSNTVTTNLYKLIETLQNYIGPEDDELVVATVIYLLRAGRATFLYNMGASHFN
jgi:hypothetical protein